MEKENKCECGCGYINGCYWGECDDAVYTPGENDYQQGEEYDNPPQTKKEGE